LLRSKWKVRWKASGELLFMSAASWTNLASEKYGDGLQTLHRHNLPGLTAGCMQHDHMLITELQVDTRLFSFLRSCPLIGVRQAGEAAAMNKRCYCQLCREQILSSYVCLGLYVLRRVMLNSASLKSILPR